MIINTSLQDLLSELESFGQDNDAHVTERSRRMLNITRSTGEFLAVIVQATAAQRVLEIGTSNGYSTLWLADALGATGGVVTTIEASNYKISLARKNFARSGLSAAITLVEDDAGHFLARAEDAAFDLIFLDSERAEYSNWWPHLTRLLLPGGLLIADNAISHATEIAPFCALVETDSRFVTSLVPIGKGEFLAVKSTR